MSDTVRIHIVVWVRVRAYGTVRWMITGTDSCLVLGSGGIGSRDGGADSRLQRPRIGQSSLRDGRGNTLGP